PALPGMGRVFVLVAGATLLAGQVSWSRISTAVVGSTLGSASLTLSAAMAGLGLGALLAGSLRHPRRALAAVVPLCSLILAVTPWLLLQAGRVEGSSSARRILAAASRARWASPSCSRRGGRWTISGSSSERRR